MSDHLCETIAVLAFIALVLGLPTVGWVRQARELRRNARPPVVVKHRGKVVK